MTIRRYIRADYDNLVLLYKQKELYGGIFDDNRDSKEKLDVRITRDPDSILVAYHDDTIVGSISLIEDGRVAWLYRFCIVRTDKESEIADMLYETACEILRKRGHDQVLVYTPVGNERLNTRYEKLGFSKGGGYTCYWKNI